MKFLLYREVVNQEFTLGSLFLNGSRFGYTCEDRDRELEIHPDAKIKGQSAIPRGLFRLTVTMSARFGRLMPLIVGVPGFEGVRIHGGNTAADTEGCPLLGEIRTADGVRKCADVVQRLTDAVQVAESAGIGVWIEVK